MTGLKSIIGKRITKKVKFLDTDVTIKKLTVSEVKELQEFSKGSDEVSEDRMLDLIQFAIAKGVEGGEELTRAELENFPIDDLNKLVEQIMVFSGIGAQKGK